MVNYNIKVISKVFASGNLVLRREDIGRKMPKVGSLHPTRKGHIGSSSLMGKKLTL